MIDSRFATLERTPLDAKRGGYDQSSPKKCMTNKKIAKVTTVEAAMILNISSHWPSSVKRADLFTSGRGFIWSRRVKRIQPYSFSAHER